MGKKEEAALWCMEGAKKLFVQYVFLSLVINFLFSLFIDINNTTFAGSLKRNC